MRTVIVKLTGPSIFVPHKERKALLAVLPNGTHLGKSSKKAIDGTSLSRHWPILWAEDYDADGNQLLSFPEEFLGSRLVFRFIGERVEPIDLDLSAITSIAEQGWIQIDSTLLSAPRHDDRVAAQILMTQGRVEVSKSTTDCYEAWSTDYGWSKSTIPLGLTVTLNNVKRIEVEALSYIPVPNKEILYRDLCEDPNPLTLWVGNFCAENVTEWIHNSIDGRSEDADFLWAYGLSTNADVLKTVQEGRKLPIPVVDGSNIDGARTEPEEAFVLTRGGGGNVGCECRICIDKPRAFDY